MNFELVFIKFVIPLEPFLLLFWLSLRMHYKLSFSIVIGPILSKIVNPKVIDIIKSKSITPTFDPSMKTLTRIVKFMLEHPSEGKTRMALDTKLNYARLAKHIVWIEKKVLPNLQFMIIKYTFH